MGEPVLKKVKVINASYSEEADSILLLCEFPEGRANHQIHSSCFQFRPGQNKALEMEKTAQLMIGKHISIVFDPDLDERIKANAPIKYGR
jgi:hypothetical protein